MAFARRDSNAIFWGAAVITYRHGAGARASTLRTELAKFEANLDRGLHLSLFSYEDAQCEYPERLVAEWVSEALQSGAVLRNYTQALEIVVHEGKARGLRVRDALSSDEFEISADWVVNASGPWADEVLHSSELVQQRLIGGVRGSRAPRRGRSAGRRRHLRTGDPQVAVGFAASQPRRSDAASGQG